MELDGGQGAGFRDSLDTGWDVVTKMKLVSSFCFMIFVTLQCAPASQRLQLDDTDSTKAEISGDV